MLVVLVVALAIGVTPVERAADQRRSANAIGKTINCPQCSGESVADSNAAFVPGGPPRHRQAVAGRPDRRPDPRVRWPTATASASCSPRPPPGSPASCGSCRSSCSSWPSPGWPPRSGGGSAAPTSTPPPPIVSWSVGPSPPSTASRRGRRRPEMGERPVSGAAAGAGHAGPGPSGRRVGDRRSRARRRRRREGGLEADPAGTTAARPGPRRRRPTQAVVDRELGPDELAALEEQRAFLLTSLRDLEAEHDVGDVDDHDYEQLEGRLHGPGRGGHPGHRRPPPPGRGPRPPDRRGAAGSSSSARSPWWRLAGRRARGPVGRPARRRRHHHRWRPPEHP